MVRHLAPRLRRLQTDIVAPRQERVESCATGEAKASNKAAGNALPRKPEKSEKRKSSKDASPPVFPPSCSIRFQLSDAADYLLRPVGEKVVP